MFQTKAINKRNEDDHTCMNLTLKFMKKKVETVTKDPHWFAE